MGGGGGVMMKEGGDGGKRMSQGENNESHDLILKINIPAQNIYTAYDYRVNIID